MLSSSCDPVAAQRFFQTASSGSMVSPFLRVFLQTNSAIDRRNVQAVFVYRYRPPFGTVQVAYQRGTAEFGQRPEPHAVPQAHDGAVSGR